MHTSERRSCSTCERGDPVLLGALLGIANVIVVAAGIELMEPSKGGELAVVVFMFGLLPGVLTGAVIGRLAHRVRDWSVWTRQILLAVPALFVVVLLGETFHLRHYVVLAFMPTIAAALWLERRTRETRLPVARALSWAGPL